MFILFTKCVIKMPDNDIKKDKIRSLLTPDVHVCGGCKEHYKEEASCHICGKNMLDADYADMVYECPICSQLYCEGCWKKKEGDVHTVDKEEELF